jgi:hypothetical protein
MPTAVATISAFRDSRGARAVAFGISAATGGSDKDEDQGGETWWERDHLAAPPAGWHAPVSKAKSAKKHMLAKQEPKEATCH